MIDDLTILRAGLARSFSSATKSPEAWSDPRAMARARSQVHHDHGGAGIAADPRSITTAVATFKESGEISGFQDLKYLCLGAGMLDESGWSLLADETLRSRILQTTEQSASEHRRLRCFQALLSAYWTFPINSKKASAESKAGWRSLRTWLRSESDRLSNLSVVKPPWYAVLERHKELLTGQPCDKFGLDLLRGDSSSLNDAREGLSIPVNSWVIDEAVFAQMKAASDLGDTQFKSVLPSLIEIAMGRSGVPVSENLKIRCVARLISRYAACVDRPEQPALRDSATSTIGNPWLRRDRWDAWVRSDKKPDDQARDMVFGWLKGKLITDFFELLSVDGVNDSRRLAYWLRFAPFVDDMWFGLGSLARANRSTHFAEFCERAKGRLLNLEGTTADNNAFVMRIGAYLAVEFGAAGNAFYLFRWDTLSQSLLEALNSGKRSASVHVTELRNDAKVVSLRHRDSPVALQSWEQKFDDKLVGLIGRPEERPACVPELEILVGDTGIEVSDLRNSGGAFWVYEPERTSFLARKLQSMGFAFRFGRGWYKE